MVKIAEIDKEVIESLLELYTAATGYPVALYEGNRVVIPRLSLEKFQPYCRQIRNYPKGRSLCDEDHKRRGSGSVQEGFHICHAGLFNYTLPIQVNGQWMGTLLCGQVRLADRESQLRSLERHEYVAKEIGLLVRELGKEFRLVPVIDVHRGEGLELVDHLHTVQRQFYELLQSASAIEHEKEAFAQSQENIAHEFQIRLQGLLAYGENLRNEMGTRRSTSPQTLHDADEVVNSVQRLNVMVQNLSLGLGDYDFKECDLAKIVGTSVALYRSEAERKNVTFRVLLAEESIIEASPLHIEHMINNLVSNAVKYSYRGTRAQPRYVEIKGKLLGGTYELSVENYGIGILPEETDDIFRKGYRGILTRDEQRTGAGLGLAIAKEIVDEHNGTIRAASTHVGAAHVTCLTVRLPSSRAPLGG